MALCKEILFTDCRNSGRKQSATGDIEVRHICVQIELDISHKDVLEGIQETEEARWTPKVLVILKFYMYKKRVAFHDFMSLSYLLP